MHRSLPAIAVTIAISVVVATWLTGCGSLSSRENLGVKYIAVRELSNDPILRLETEMHTAAIRSISLDLENRYLVTGSEDKTVRLWGMVALANGKIKPRLINVLRPPIGDPNEGKIYSVAISPNGNTIACGGWTGLDWEGSVSIYFFNRKTGELIHRISGLPNVIYDIAYSPYGSLLAVTLGGNSGVRVYRVSDYSLIGSDKKYGGQSHSAHYELKGKLVTTCYDGILRLYDNKMKLIAKTRPSGGKQLYSAKFSPDGSKIAVGFTDSPQVQVFSGENLSFLYQPDTQGIDNGELGSVAWSVEGSLYAAGSYWHQEHKKRVVVKWEKQGKSGIKPNFLPASGNTIQDLLPFGSGVIFAGSGPAFGLFKANDQLEFYKQSSLADYRDSTKFLISADGKTIQFGYHPTDKDATIQFSIEEREIQLLVADNKLSPAITSAAGLALSDWKHSYSPKLNGGTLPLEPFDKSRTVAIVSGNNSFVLGSDRALHLFDREGRQTWRIPTPGVVWAVNVPKDGKMAVATLGDGTIRWYRLKDGQELLAFLPYELQSKFSSERQYQWVMWTPSSHYDAYPGASKYIGWHKNSTLNDAADFFPIPRGYYQPDVIAKVLETLDVAEAIRLSKIDTDKNSLDVRKTIPPVVTIVSPEDGSEIVDGKIAVRYRVRNLSGIELDKVKILVNGRPIEREGTRGLALEDEEGETEFAEAETTDNEEVSEIFTNTSGLRTVKVTIPPHLRTPNRVCTVSVVAKNKFSVSEPAISNLRWIGEAAEVPLPKLYILAVGVSDYHNNDKVVKKSVPKLKYAHKDAGDFVAMMKKQGPRFLFEMDKSLIADIKNEKITPALKKAFSGNIELGKDKVLRLLQLDTDHWQLTDRQNRRDPIRYLIKRQQGKLGVYQQLLYRDVEARILANDEATRSNILKGLKWIREQTTSKDVAMVFLAGHGIKDFDGNYYYLPVEAELDDISSTCLRFSDINQTVVSLVGKSVFFVDTCHSGNKEWTKRDIMIDGNELDLIGDIAGIANELTRAENGVVVFASSSGRQSSLEDKKWENGAFTEALLDGLSGKAARGGKRITINMLDYYLSEEVKKLTAGKQTPTTTKPRMVPDFPVAISLP